MASFRQRSGAADTATVRWLTDPLLLMTPFAFAAPFVGERYHFLSDVGPFLIRFLIGYYCVLSCIIVYYT